MEYLVKEGYMRARQDKRKTVFYKDLGKFSYTQAKGEKQQICLPVCRLSICRKRNRTV